jgi:type IV pilus assembly protein PilN
MILINLLPHREAARKSRQERFYATLGFAALVGVLISVSIYTWYVAKIDAQRGKNSYLSVEIKRLDGQIKDIATLQAEITALRARQNAVEDLQGNRNLPVDLLSELVRQLPDGVYINSMKQENQNILITGVAQSNERVSELLRNISNNSSALTKPDLVEITATTISLNPRDQRRVSNFSMRLGLKRASDSKAPASGVLGVGLPAAAASSKTSATSTPVKTS